VPEACKQSDDDDDGDEHASQIKTLLHLPGQFLLPGSQIQQDADLKLN